MFDFILAVSYRGGAGLGLFFVNIILMIVGGALAASSLIASKSEEAGEAVKKLAPYQSWIGLALLVWGVISLIRLLSVVRYMGFLMRLLPVYTITLWVAVIVTILLGLILSLNFMKQRKEVPTEKVEALEKKLKPIQVPVGIIAIADAVVLLLAALIGF
jgi:hypothetical protein